MASNTSPSRAPRVAAVTVSYGSGDVLPAMVDSVRSASAAPVLLVIADNKPIGDQAVEVLATASGAGYIALPSNPGYGSAVNAAVMTIPDSIEWILVINPDVSMSPGSLDVLIAAGDEDPLIGSVGPETLTSDGEIYPSARAVPSLRTGVGHALFANLWLDNPWSRAYRSDSATEPVRRDAGWLSGACILLRRSSFEAIGGFDDGYFMYFEDVDLGYRLGKAGYRNVYEPAAVVTHTGAHSTTSESARMIAAHHDSARRFLNRKYARRWMWPIRVSLRVGLSLRSAIVRRRLNDQ